MGFSEQPKQVLASTDTQGSSPRAEQTWSWAQQKSFGKVLPLSCSEVCFQPTGSCVSRPRRCLPSKELFQDFGKCVFPIPKDSVSCSPRVQSFPAAQPGKPLAGSVAGQRTTVAPGEDSAGISHEDLGLLGGSSLMFTSTQCPPELSVVNAGEAFPGIAWL